MSTTMTMTAGAPGATVEDLAVQTRDLTKRYGDALALDGLDLEVRRGEVFGFLGPNGAGKSTTIRTLLDQARPTSGTATVLGLDAQRDSLAIRRRTGYVPGDLALWKNLTGAATLRYLARLRGGVDQGRVDHLARRLDADLTKKVGSYSTGNRQKIGLIQAFMHRPELLVLDEPNAGLDPLVQQEFLAMVEEVRAEGRTVLLSSHTLSEVERVADRVGIVRAGRLVVVESVAALRTKAVRTLDLEFAAPVDQVTFTDVPGVRSADVDGTSARVVYEGSVDPVLRAATAHEVVALTSREADLEEVFLGYYKEAPGAR